MHTQDDLIALAKKIAADHHLDSALVCAVCEQESGWNPWAIRFEPAFMAKYVSPLFTSGKVSATEAYARAFSWGLMQLMGQCAREIGFQGPFLPELCDPAAGLEYGCRHLVNKLRAAGGDVMKGLLLWNGGGNPAYPGEVLARIEKYK